MRPNKVTSALGVRNEEPKMNRSIAQQCIPELFTSIKRNF